MLSKHKKIIACIILVLCIGLFIVVIDKNKKTSNDFDESLMIEKTKVFLMERANLLSGDKSELQISSNFYAPTTQAEREKEIALRKDINSYAEVIKGSGNVYTNPNIALEFLKHRKDEAKKVVIKASEVIKYEIKGADTDTGFANEHIFTYVKINGEWKLVKDEILGGNSMVSPVK